MLTGYGQWEYNVQANNTETSSDQAWTRLAFAGIKVGDYGSFDYGRNYGVLYDVEGWTDMLPEFGGDSYTYADNFMAGRANGVANLPQQRFLRSGGGSELRPCSIRVKTKARTRRISTSAPITAAATAMFASTMAMVFGLSTSYDFGMGISAAAAYTSSDRTGDQQHYTHTERYAKGDKADAWTAGLKYDANGYLPGDHVL
ncbi:outer membrane pore protein N, non-specific [Klebsiella pneumoniae subsp. rhinoscleromatis]|nr:outer membrane pore protein N, non-specific [Klebsiella pneumoniae subsp. rhinoscleromatis]